MRLRQRLFFVFVFAAFSCNVVAAERLTARLFPQAHPRIQAEWSNGNSRDVESALIHARMRETELRLDIPSAYTAPPKQVRIYLVIPQQLAGLQGNDGLVVNWQTQGRFYPGSARQGERVLLFEGLVDSAVLSDVISFEFAIEPRAMHDTLEFEPIYEIEEK